MPVRLAVDVHSTLHRLLKMLSECRFRGLSINPAIKTLGKYVSAIVIPTK